MGPACSWCGKRCKTRPWSTDEDHAIPKSHVRVAKGRVAQVAALLRRLLVRWVHDARHAAAAFESLPVAGSWRYSAL